jgi:hypothetical protein
MPNRGVHGQFLSKSKPYPSFIHLYGLVIKSNPLIFWIQFQMDLQLLKKIKNRLCPEMLQLIFEKALKNCLPTATHHCYPSVSNLVLGVVLPYQFHVADDQTI